MTKPELAMWANQDGTGRAYKHPFRLGSDDKPLQSPSVTTVLKLVDKGDAIVQWAVNQTVDWIAENQSLIYTKSPESVRQWGKYRWKDARDIRAEVGTGIHETIEAIHTGSWNFPELDDEQRLIMDQWALMNERYKFTPKKTEFTVWYPHDGQDYAGTADGYWDIEDTQTGEFWEDVLIDLKTSKNTWPEHWMQLSALRRAGLAMVKQDDGTWIEEEFSRTGPLAIIHLRADSHKVTVESREDWISARFGQFMGYRHLWGLNKEIEDIDKQTELAKYTSF